MGGFFGVASKNDCVLELFYGVDYHSHLGTRRGGMATHGKAGFNRAIHNIENSPFRTKFERDVEEMEGNLGIGCISDFEPQPLLIQSHLGSFAITTVGKINNADRRDGKGAVLRAHQNRLRLVVGDAADAHGAVHGLRFRSEFGSKRRVLNVVDRLVEAGLGVIDRHAGPACAEVGVVIHAEEQVEDAVFPGCSAKKSAHKLKLPLL